MCLRRPVAFRTSNSVGEFERFVTQKLLDVAKRVAKEELEDEKWIHRVARVSKRSYEETRVLILEFLDTDVFHVSLENCISFLDPLIESWDIEFENFGMEIVLNRRLTRSHLKKLEFREAEPEPTFEMEPGLKEFLDDAKLSAGIAEHEIAFLKSLSLDGKRPSPLYYYRELQNLRDPISFLPLSIGKRPEPETKTPATKPEFGERSPKSRSLRGVRYAVRDAMIDSSFVPFRSSPQEIRLIRISATIQ